MHPSTELFTRLLGFAPDYWAFHPTTGLCTRRLGFSPDYWAFQPTTGLCIQLLGFSPDYWAFHPTTRLCTRLLGFAHDYWALHPTTGLCTRLLGSDRGGWINTEKRFVQVNLFQPYFLELKYLFLSRPGSPILARPVSSLGSCSGLECRWMEKREPTPRTEPCAVTRVEDTGDICPCPL